MNIKLKELAEKIGGELFGDGDIDINSAAPIESAREGQITFLANPKYEKFLETTDASVVILPIDTKFDRLAVIKHKDPYYAYALALDL